MINKSFERKSDLRNASILEVIIAVILILIIFIFFQGETISGYQKLDVQIAELKKEINDFKLLLEEKNSEIFKLKSKITRLEGDIEYYKKITGCTTADECSKLGIDEINRLTTKIEELTTTNLNLRNQIERLEERISNGKSGDGVVEVPGSPPCQLDTESPKIRFHGLLVRSAEGWRFEPELVFEKGQNTGPRKINIKNKIIEEDGLKDLFRISVDRSLTLKEFERYSLIAYKKSVERSCRYYVKYVDNEFIQKAQIRLMEKYFYIARK